MDHSIPFWLMIICNPFQFGYLRFAGCIIRLMMIDSVRTSRFCGGVLHIKTSALLVLACSAAPILSNGFARLVLPGLLESLRLGPTFTKVVEILASGI